jgi:hypothetical protein
MIRLIYIIITKLFVTIQSVTVIVTVTATVNVTVIVIVVVHRSHFFAHQQGKGAMSNWSPPPASLPDWAKEENDDDQKLKNVKQLLSVTTAMMLETHSEFLAKKRYSEELERYVRDMKKEIETLKEELKHKDELINVQRAHIHSLSILMPKQ